MQIARPPNDHRSPFSDHKILWEQEMRDKCDHRQLSKVAIRALWFVVA